MCVCVCWCACVFHRATQPEVYFTVYDYQLTRTTDKDGENLLKANQVCLILSSSSQCQAHLSADAAKILECSNIFRPIVVFDELDCVFAVCDATLFVPARENQSVPCCTSGTVTRSRRSIN